MESIRRTFRRLTNSLRHFRRSDDGNYMVFVAIAAIPMVAMAGLGVDLARAFLAEARLQSAIDAAAIAMGSADGTDDEIKSLGRMFFYANFPDDFWASPGNLEIDMTRVGGDPTARPESFIISATAEVDTLFFRMLPYAGEATQVQRQAAISSGNYDTIDVAAKSTALTEVQGLEVVLVLDVTGSMYNSYSSGERRIEAMRDAALNMINILFGGIEEPELLRVAIVPYNTAVNIGTQMHPYVLNDGLNPDGTPAADNPFGQTEWYGCVQARKDDYDLADVFIAGETNGSGEWEAYRWPIEPDRRSTGSTYNYCETRAHNTTGDYYYYEDPLDIETTDPHPAEKVNYEASEPDSWYDADGNIVNGRRYYDRDSDGPNKGCPGALLPLTNNYEEVWDYLQNVTVVDGNGTITATGLNWGWRVISPGPPFMDSKPYADNGWQKAIIVLTDGQQVISSQHGSCDNAPRFTQPLASQPPVHLPWEFNPVSRNMNGIAIDEGPDYRWTAYGYVHPADSAPLGGGNITTILEDRLEDTCDAIKAVEDPTYGGSAIDIFSITFGDQAQPGTTISTMMANCTTDPQNNYFHAPDTSTLNAAFEEIARKLTSLRLTD